MVPEQVDGARIQEPQGSLEVLTPFSETTGKDKNMGKDTSLNHLCRRDVEPEEVELLFKV